MLNPVADLKEVLAENRTVRAIEDGIYSVLPESAAKHDYDRKAGLYDLVVSTRLYNSIMWGSSPLEYRAFARGALESSPGGLVLDAACGSLLFTAPIYRECQRKIVAFDQSVAMLRRARKRLINSVGRMPEHVVLLQADVSDLPFRPASFQTVLCMNVLHHIEDAAALLPRLQQLLVNGGHLYLTSLVTNNRFIAWASDNKFQITDRVRSDGPGKLDPAMVCVVHSHTTRPDEVNDSVLQVFRAAKQFGGEYDGWETRVEKQQ